MLESLTKFTVIISGERLAYLMLPFPKLPFPNIDHVFGRCFVQGHYRLTPVKVAKRNPMQRMRIKHGPISLQSHAVVPQGPADDAITAALALEQREPFLSNGRSAILAMRGHIAVYKRFDGCSTESISRAAIGKECLDIADVVMAPGGR